MLSLIDDTSCENGEITIKEEPLPHLLDKYPLSPEMCQVTTHDKFRCSVKDCRASFSTGQSLKTHLGIIHNLSVIKCPRENCDVYLKPSSLKQHVMVVHDKAQSTCKNCGRVGTFKAISAHQTKCIKNGVKTFFCRLENCQSSFVTVRDLKSHRLYVHAEPQKCPRKDCNSYLKPHNVAAHIRMVHDNLKRHCPNCGKQMLRDKLEEHASKCARFGGRQFLCSSESCGMAFKNNHDRINHMRRRHQKPIKCPHEGCNVIKKPYLILRHLKSAHTEFVNCDSPVKTLEDEETLSKDSCEIAGITVKNEFLPEKEQ